MTALNIAIVYFMSSHEAVGNSWSYKLNQLNQVTNGSEETAAASHRCAPTTTIKTVPSWNVPLC